MTARRAFESPVQFSLRACRGRSWGSSLPHSGGTAALGRQVDEVVAGLRQLCDGHAAPLPDELGHGVQLPGRDGDELPPVVNHTWGGQANREVGGMGWGRGGLNAVVMTDL